MSTNSSRPLFIHANFTQFVTCALRTLARNQPMILTTSRDDVTSITCSDSAAVCATVNHTPTTVESFAEGFTGSNVHHVVIAVRVYRYPQPLTHLYFYMTVDVHAPQNCKTVINQTAVAEDAFKIVSLQSTTFPRLFLAASNYLFPLIPSDCHFLFEGNSLYSGCSYDSTYVR